ncbi:hypothetical protein J2X55_000485 [Microbacterium sp. 1154]|nr:hypothetical protein [Microbacterium sp. 1154]
MPSGYELAATVATWVTNIRPLENVSAHRERGVTSRVLPSTSHLHVQQVVRGELIAALLVTAGGARHNGRARRAGLAPRDSWRGFHVKPRCGGKHRMTSCRREAQDDVVAELSGDPAVCSSPATPIAQRSLAYLSTRTDGHGRDGRRPDIGRAARQRRFRPMRACCPERACASPHDGRAALVGVVTPSANGPRRHRKTRIGGAREQRTVAFHVKHASQWGGDLRASCTLMGRADS